MNKPIIFASAMFTAVFGAALARSYFTQDEIHWVIELISALGISVVVYALEQRRQQKTESKSDLDDSKSECGLAGSANL